MLSLCWRTSLGILISMFSITYHLVQNSCSYPVNGAVHFISPYVPARGGTAGKQLHTGHVSHQGLNAAAGLLRFFAVFLNAGMNHLMDISFVPLGVASGRQQAQFRVGSRPVSWSPKYCVSSPVQLDPDKSCGLKEKPQDSMTPHASQSIGIVIQRNRAQSSAASSEIRVLIAENVGC